MSWSPSVPPPEALLAHRQFIRAIVRSLLRGADGEDDVVQQTLLHAAQSGPSQPGRLRAWLAAIARNLTLDHLRRRRRRDVALARLPAPGAAPSAAEVLAQEEERRRVVHAVLSLAQPYRDAVLLRYWEGLEPAAIAERLAVPATTVRSWLHRGLAMLRQRLDADYGGRSAWTLALASFLRVGEVAALPAASGLSTGVVLMSKSKFAFGAVAALLLGCLLWVWLQHEPPQHRVHADAGAVREAPTPQSAGQGDAATTPGTADAAPSARVAAGPAGELVVQGLVRHQGAPYPGLALVLQWFDGVDPDGAAVSEHAVTSGVDGTFRWQGPRRERVSCVRAITRVPCKVWSYAEVALPEDELIAVDVSVLPLDRTLHGRVHDGTGVPIAGARLDINGFDETVVRTDANGRYEMPVPAPGYPLLVGAEGYRGRLIQGYMPANVRRHEFDVQLLAGAEIAGRVVDESGVPVAGAKVRASGMFRAESVSDADGRFALRGADPEDRHLLTARKPGFQRGEVAAKAGDAGIEIVLRPGRDVVVRVQTADGRPVVGAVVHFVRDSHSGWQRQGNTGLDGRFTLHDMGQAPFEVVVEKRGLVRQQHAVDPTKDVGEVVIAMAPGQAVSGVVVDSAGKPVADAWVHCEVGDGAARRSVGSRARSDGNGRFRVDEVPSGACMVIAHHVDYRQASEPWTGDAPDGPTLRLQKAPCVGGQVLDAATGRPVTEFTVRIAADPGKQPLFLDPRACQDEQGRWQVRHWQMVEGAELFVEVRAKGYAPMRVRLVALVDPPAEQAVVRLVPGRTLQGIVVDAASGIAIAGATVALQTGDPGEELHRHFDAPFQRDEGFRGELTTDAAGRFTIESVPPGVNFLRLAHPDYPAARFGPIQVEPGVGVMPLQVTMARGVRVRGRVTGRADAAGLPVHAFGEGDQGVEATVRADLSFELAGLGQGLRTVYVADRAGRAKMRRIQVGDRDVDDVELAFASGTGSVRVEVRGGVTRGQAQLVPMAGTQVDRGKGFDVVQFGAETFTIDGLAPGRYRVTVDAEVDDRRGVGEVDVGSGESTVVIECRSGR